jgi:uncharacterized membrane protein
MTDEAKNRQLCMTLYGLYVAGVLLQFTTPLLVTLGALFMTIVLILAYSKRKETRGTLFESHFHWMIRTFWIGTGIFLPIIFVLSMVAMWFGTNWEPLAAAMSTGDPGALSEAAGTYMKDNELRLLLITFGSMLPAALWWINRCWVGYKRLKDSLPIENPQAWT